MNNTDILMALLRSEITEVPVGSEVKEAIDGECIAELFRIAKIHDFTQTVFSALKKCGLLSRTDPLYMQFEEAEELAFFRCKRLDNALSEIKRTLAEAKIEYVALKGAVMRPLYPSRLMRMSADVDVLVRESALDGAVAALESRLGYKKSGGKDFHDISLYSPDGMHLELHYNIKENSDALDEVLEGVWDYTRPVADGAYERTLTPEFFAFHLITHMVYHFINGGCGIKPFSDLWLWRKRVGYDENNVLSLCRECGIERFYKNAVELSDVWFEGRAHTPITERMEAHVVHNAICGNVEKGVVVRQSKSGGRLGYMLGRIFMPYRSLKIRYPIVAKCPILLPVFEVVRWFSLLFGDKSRVKRELAGTKGVSDKQISALIDFYNDLGLKV